MSSRADALLGLDGECEITARRPATHAHKHCNTVSLLQLVTLHLADLYGMNIMTLLPNYLSMPVKDPDNLLMARVVDHLIAQLINLGVEKEPLSSSGSSPLLCA